MTEYNRVLNEVLYKIVQQLNEYNKIYQSLPHEEKCKYDELQAKLDQLKEILYYLSGDDIEDNSVYNIIINRK